MCTRLVLESDTLYNVSNQVVLTLEIARQMSRISSASTNRYDICRTKNYFCCPLLKDLDLDIIALTAELFLYTYINR